MNSKLGWDSTSVIIKNNKSIKLLNLQFLIFLGLTFLFGSLGYKLIVSKPVHLCFLFFGLALVLLASVKRIKKFSYRLIRFLILTIFIMSIFVLQQFMQGYLKEILDINIILQLVIFILFIAGAFMGSTVMLESKISLLQIFIMALFVVIGFIALIFDIQQVLKEGMIRAYSDDDLNPNGAAYTSAIICILFFYVLLQAETVLSKSIAIITMVIAIFSIFFTGSRGASLFLLIVFFLRLLSKNKIINTLTKKTKSRKFRLILSIFFPVLFLFIFSMYFIEAEVIYSRIDYLLDRFFMAYDHIFNPYAYVSDMSIAEREYLQKYYLNNWIDWFPFGMKEYGVYPYPHNQLIELGARFGFTGILLSLIIFAILVRSSVFILFSKNKLFLQEIIFFWMMFLFSYLQSMTSLSLEINRALFLGFGYFIGFFYLGGIKKATNQIGIRNSD